MEQQKFLPIFYQTSGDIVRFVYFSGYNYKTVSAENYFGMRDWIMASGAKYYEGDIEEKYKELQAPIDASEELVRNQKELLTCHWSLVTTERKPDGTYFLTWTEEVSPRLKEENPFVI